MSLITVGALLAQTHAYAQKYAASKSTVSFYSHATIEDIKAANTTSIALADLSTNTVAFSISIKDFAFDKKLMQEHFNEKYMESEKYPKSTFQGTVQGFDATKKGEQAVKAIGKLTMHGVTKDVELPGTMEATTDTSLSIKATFTVKLEDYKIKIPQVLWQNIAEEIEVKVDFTLLKK
ncbi:MAG: YceI family protein [Bacteroidetes bacterium]|nr:YceI family protein [Bacteroidota bacterium]